MQALFSKFNIFSNLALFLMVMGFDHWLMTVPNRSDRPDRTVAVRFEPARFEAGDFAPLRLAGAWQVMVDDPRFGGISALAVDRGHLLALTDSGSLVRFPKPGEPSSRALLRDLPAGPGSPRFKSSRDSEALARDPGGRGWWVAFENHHQLWLYDQEFRRPLGRLRLPARGWRVNRGIEGMIAASGGLLLFHEGGQTLLRPSEGRTEFLSVDNRFGALSDAAMLPDGRLLLIARNVRLGGVDNRLVEGTWLKNGLMAVRPFSELGLGPLDNVEALAAEPLGHGGVRLWLMTDNDFRPGRATVLVALDLPGKP